jgi:hypothetical protein
MAHLAGVAERISPTLTLTLTMKLTTALILAATAIIHAEVTVTVGDIEDKRTNSKSFGGGAAEVKLKVAGPELAECKGLRVSVKDVADDTGKAIKQQKRFGNDGGFEKPEKPFGGFGEKKENEFEVKLELENPARAAKTLKITGSVDVLMPSKDPASVITASPAKDHSKPLASPALKAAGAEITLDEPKGEDLGYKIKDPNNKVASVEFCSADGKALETQGWSRSGFGGAKNVSISFKDKPPKDAIAKVYLVTDKSVMVVPLKLDAVPLP